jgi:hypothetical protein
VRLAFGALGAAVLATSLSTAAGRSDIEEMIRLGQIKLAEEGVGHLTAPVLTGVDVKDTRELHEVGPRPDDVEDVRHVVAFVRTGGVY